MSQCDVCAVCKGLGNTLEIATERGSVLSGGRERCDKCQGSGTTHIIKDNYSKEMVQKIKDAIRSYERQFDRKKF